MASNIRAFDLALRNFGRHEVPEAFQRFHRAVALEALRGVVLMSPVDTGRFRGNWQVTHHAPATGETHRTDKNGGATIQSGAAEVAKIQPYEVTWLSNNVPYATRLEQGYSQQAPAGMVAVTVERLRSRFSR